MSNMGTSTFYQGSGESTEFEDILREKGILPPKEDEKAKVLNELLDEAKELAEASRDHLAEKNLDQLDELEDEFADSRTLDAYRKARVAQLREMALKNRFGRVYPLSRDDFKREVTEASNVNPLAPPSSSSNQRAQSSEAASSVARGGAGRSGGRDDDGDEEEEESKAHDDGEEGTPVVVLLFKGGIPQSRLLEEIVGRLAEKHKATKFMKIVADQCIEAYPDRNVPTLLFYYKGEVKANIVGLGTLGGLKANVDTVEWVLAKAGALQTELEEDPRKKLEKDARPLRGRRGSSDDEDDD